MFGSSDDYGSNAFPDPFITGMAFSAVEDLCSDRSCYDEFLDLDYAGGKHRADLDEPTAEDLAREEEMLEEFLSEREPAEALPRGTNAKYVDRFMESARAGELTFDPDKLSWKDIF